MLSGLAQHSHLQVGDRFYKCNSEVSPESSCICATQFNLFNHGGSVSSPPSYSKLEPEARQSCHCDQGKKVARRYS